MAYTVFTTYLLVPSGSTQVGYSQAIHCNYIKSIVLDTDNPEIMELNMSFPSKSDLKFLASDLSLGTGFTASNIYALVQLVQGSGSTITSNAANWKMIDITPDTHAAGTPLTIDELTDTAFRISLYGWSNNTNGWKQYNLNYLKYPNDLNTDIDKLCFGEETYFLGNVKADIHADVYVTDLAITLPMAQFNSSTNPTWSKAVPKPSSVFITEIGIYDANKNLVAIGKLNKPIDKNALISRTILFAIDF